MCFQRESGDPVRGCLGSNTHTSTDYCMKAIYAGPNGVELTLAALATEAPTEAPTTSLAPSSSPPTISPTTSLAPSSSSVPSAIPTTSSAPTPFPTTATPTARPTRRPTPRPTNRPTTPRPTKNPSGLLDYFTTKNDNLKGECEGDCNSDADCAVSSCLYTKCGKLSVHVSNPLHIIFLYSNSYLLSQHRVISFVIYEKQERIYLAVKGLQ